MYAGRRRGRHAIMHSQRIGLLRHGTTAWNSQARIQGQTETDLSPEGRREVRSWIPVLEAMNWQLILCSTLVRAVQTAEIINEALHLPLHKDARLQEQDWGDWTGKSLKNLYTTQATTLRFQENQGWNFRPPQGENRQEVRARAHAALQAFLQHRPGENILVITHQGVIKALVYHLLHRSFLPSEPEVLTARGLHILTRQEKTFAIHQLNCRGI